MKAAQQYGQDLASQQYDKEYDRAAKEYFNKYDQAANQFSNYYNRLESYLQKSGLQGGLDAYLKQKVKYDDPFESYLQKSGLQGGLDTPFCFKYASKPPWANAAKRL